MARVGAIVVVLSGTLGALGCAGSEASTSLLSASIDDVEVAPPNVELSPGQSSELAVEVETTGEAGELSVTWKSGDPGVAAVQRTGGRTAQVTGTPGGSVWVTAVVTASNVPARDSGRAAVFVEEQAAAENAAVSPPEAGISVGETITLHVDVQTSGNVEGLSVAWSTGDPAVATVDGNGLQATVTGEGRGTVAITATVSAKNVEDSFSVSSSVSVG